MKKSLLKFVIPIILFTSLILTGCGAEEGKTESKSEKRVKLVLVETKTAALTSFQDVIEVFGAVKAVQTSKVGATSGGKIVKFFRDKGSYVNVGDTICVLENDILKANLEAAKADYELSEINYRKQKKIYEENVSSEFQYLQAQYQRDAKKAAYEMVKAQFDKTFIKAPISGIIDTKDFEVGEVLSPGFPVVTIINTGSIKVEAGVPEKYVSDITTGKQVKVIFDELNTEMNGFISYTGKSVNTANRTFPVEINLSNPGGVLKPELNARVQVMKGTLNDVYVFPAEIITKTDLGYVVFVASEKDGEEFADMRVVEIVGRSSNKVALRGNLAAGDQVITVGYQSLVNGERIQVVK